MDFDNKSFNKLNQNDMLKLTETDKNAFIIVKDGIIVNKVKYLKDNYYSVIICVSM